MPEKGPIGVFDSGFGGLTIFSKIISRLPQYDYLYLGDNARTPYGNRSFETVLQFTREAVTYLFGRGCPLVILACNTASAKALRTLQQTWLPSHYPDRKILGVIRPSVEAIAQLPDSKKIGVWATAGTVRSESFVVEIEKYAPGRTVVQQACPMLVPLVEAGELSGDGVDFFIQKYWNGIVMQQPDTDTLLLGCTHYPLLKNEIRRIVPGHVRIISQDEIVAPSLEAYLQRHPEIKSRVSGTNQFAYLTTEEPGTFDGPGAIFMGTPVHSEHVRLE